MAKQYQIKTVQDMIDCTNEENLDNFLTDLKTLLLSAHLLTKLGEMVAEEKGLSKEMAQIESDGFTWVDDGKHDAKINVDVK